MQFTDQTFYEITVSRLMIGGRVFSKGDTICLRQLGLMRSALRSGAMRPLPKGITAELHPGTLIDPEDAPSTVIQTTRQP